MNKLSAPFARFACADDGSQVIEYALVIALVSIVLSLALSSAVSGLGSSMTEMAARVTTCFASTDGTC